jgi:hypothetical protein
MHVAFTFAYTVYRIIEAWTPSREVWRIMSIRKLRHNINSVWGYGLFILVFYDKVAVNMQ